MSFFIGPHKIDPPFLLAPMAGVSEMPFRVLAFEFGAGLATTELISAKGLYFQSLRSQQYLTYNKEKERPYSVQLFGGEEESMAKAAVVAMEAGAQIIDINMGCPVKKVTKTGAGSALMCEPGRAANLVKAMRSAVGDAVPITVKIRTGWDDKTINCTDMAKSLEDAGCAALAMHARTRAQGYSGKADWSLIKAVKKAVQIPVIGNGDVTSAQLAMQMMQETGCDGVMIGRGALGNPWIFRQLATLTLPSPLKGEGIVAAERREVLLRHLSNHIDFHRLFDDSPAGLLRAIRSFRTHLVWYSRGIRDAGVFREKIMQIENFAELQETIHGFFSSSEDSFAIETDDSDGIDYRQAFG